MASRRRRRQRQLQWEQQYQRQRHRHPSMEKAAELPENLILEVLSRLPVKAIIKCKRACKKWRKLVSDPYFVRLHLSRSPDALMVHEFYHDWSSTLKWVEIEYEAADYHFNLVQSHNSISLMFCVAPSLNSGRAHYWIPQVGSVNGLVCWFGPSPSCEEPSMIYIFNPVFKGYILLPDQVSTGLALSSYGFGVSAAGEYKVILCSSKMCFNPNTVYPVKVEVYTLGTDQWRVLEQTPYSLNYLIDGGPGVFVNSHVYWVCKGQIYDFDLNTETFELFPSPQGPGDDQESTQALGVLKGALTCISWRSLALEICVMKEGSWYKEITIQDNITTIHHLKSFCVIEDLNGTSILMFHLTSSTKMVAFCLNTNRMLPLKWLSHYYMVMSYRPSFVNLDNFESEGVHIVPYR